MSYDILPGSDEDYEDEWQEPFTIGRLLDELDSSTANSVRLIGTGYTLGALGSWRGSYDVPAFDYEEGYKSPRKLAEEIRNSLEETHWGYKGGQYNYTLEDSPYLAHRGQTGQEHKIVDVKTEQGILYLCTKIIPY